MDLITTITTFTTMKENIVTIKVYESTRNALKVIAAMEGVTQPDVLKPLVDAKLAKVKKK